MPRSPYGRKYAVFRAYLVKARKDARLTQVEVAARLGKHQSFVSKYERGERRIDVIEFLEIARAIGVKPARVLADLEPIS